MKYKRAYTVKDGDFCDPIFPTPVYRMACCDCGLVHTMRFSVAKVTKTNADGSFAIRPAPEKYVVMFQAARNNRATAAMRRERRKKHGNAKQTTP